MKKKNKSRKVASGTIIRTRDEFLESGKDYIKPGYENKGLYRLGIVIETNFADDLGIVKGSTKGIKIEGIKKTKIKPFLETTDNTGQPIKIGRKFLKTKKKITPRQVNSIKKELYVKSSKSLRNENRNKARKLKNRK